MAGLRSFDAFPKVASTHTVRSERGGLSTVLTTLLLLFMSWTEFGQYFGGTVDHQFTVDKHISQNLEINLDIVVAMPCNFIHTNVHDVTEDRFLAGELLKYEGFLWHIPSSYVVNDSPSVETPDIDQIISEGMIADFRNRPDDKNSAAPACHIYGRIPVNKVNGDFHITAKGYGYRDPRAHVDVQSLNFSHVISELSFGQFYPYIHNPLDETAQIATENLEAYQYFLSIVPTTYKKLGVDIETNQYSTSLQKKVYSNKNRGVPGIFFRYDFEAISLIVEDKRIAFSSFMVRLATIYGGIIICAQFGYRTLDKLLILIFGKRYASRGEEKSSSLLDEDNDDE